MVQDVLLLTRAHVNDYLILLYVAMDVLTIGIVSLIHLDIHNIHTALVKEQAGNLPSIRIKLMSPSIHSTLCCRNLDGYNGILDLRV